MLSLVLKVGQLIHALHAQWPYTLSLFNTICISLLVWVVATSHHREHRDATNWDPGQLLGSLRQLSRNIAMEQCSQGSWIQKGVEKCNSSWRLANASRRNVFIMGLGHTTEFPNGHRGPEVYTAAWSTFHPSSLIKAKQWGILKNTKSEENNGKRRLWNSLSIRNLQNRLDLSQVSARFVTIAGNG